MDYIVEKVLLNQALEINKLINEASNNGGGRVVFQKDTTYICGSIILKDNVTLYLEEGSVIRGSDSLDDYMLINDIPDFGKEEKNRTYEACDYNGNPAKCFIYAKDAKNIAITGEGTIDGNEEIYYGRKSRFQIEGFFYPRIPLIFLENCKNIHLNGFNIRKSGFWTIHLVGVDGGIIENLNISNSLTMANCDGIDPDHSKNLTIRNCNISAADDCIVFKNTKANMKYGSCENITVTNCNLISTSAAIKIGTETASDFKNIIVSDCNITNTNRGISIQLRDGGNITNCCFKNLNISTRRFEPKMWWGNAEVIALTSIPRDNNTTVGNINNISFSNINSFSEGGILLYSSSNNISGITLDNISMRMVKKTNYAYKGRDLRPCALNTIEEDCNNVVYIKNVPDVKINKLNYLIDDTIKSEICEPIKIV